MNKIITLMMFASLSFCSFAQDVKKINSDQFASQIFDFKNENSWHYKGTKPCIVDFFTTWCGPCKALAPRLDQLAKEYAGKVEFYSVNAEECADLSAVFGITSVPSLLFVPADGQQPQMAQGALPLDMLKQLIDTNLLGKKATSIEFVLPGE